MNIGQSIAQFHPLRRNVLEIDLSIKMEIVLIDINLLVVCSKM
jgi:hypothetical protein